MQWPQRLGHSKMEIPRAYLRFTDFILQKGIGIAIFEGLNEVSLSSVISKSLAKNSVISKI